MINKCRYALLVLGAMMLSACGTSPKTSFYLLNAEHNIEKNEVHGVSVGIWKVHLPELINRPEIVTRTGPYTIELADFHRWAGDLAGNITLLMAEELSYNLSTAYVDVSPWSAYRDLDYQVKVHVRKFDGELGGKSTFNGVYIILNGKGDKKLLEQAFSLTEKVNSKSYSGMAAAMSRLVVRLSEKISDAISSSQKSQRL